MADDEDFEKIAVIWRELGDMAYVADKYDSGAAAEELCKQLIGLIPSNEYLVYCCVFDLAEYLAGTLPNGKFDALVNKLSPRHRSDINFSLCEIPTAEEEYYSEEHPIHNKFDTVFSCGGYKLCAVELTDGYYYAIGEKDGCEIRASLSFDEDLWLSVNASIPILDTDNTQLLSEYIKWQNSSSEYRLFIDTDSDILIVMADVYSTTLDGLCGAFARFARIWETDRELCRALLDGKMDLDSCREIKRKLLQY
jgi:hypothetical protein